MPQVTAVDGQFGTHTMPPPRQVTTRAASMHAKDLPNDRADGARTELSSGWVIDPRIGTVIAQ
jgi:hypothetical protein